MLTASDIRNVMFTKSMGGYKTAEVDVFIDQCADTVDTLTREKQELTKKLEVLADKLVEYRNEEDSIRTALLSAQRLGDTVVRESNHKAGLILEDANIKAQNIVEAAQRSVKGQEQELERVRQEVANFKSRMLSIYREHLSLIDVLPEMESTAEDAENDEEKTAVKDSAPEPPADQDAVAAQETAETSAPPAVEEPIASPAPAAAPVSVPQMTEETAETGENMERTVEIPHIKSRFADLKFGEEYDISKDTEGDDSKGLFRRKK